MSTKLIFIVPVVLLLALCVVPCMAYTITNPQDGAVYNAGSTDSVTININLYQGYVIAGYYVDGNENNEFVSINSNTYSGTFPLNSNSNSQNFYFIVLSQQTGRQNIRFTVNYQYPEPEPTPTPINPYISVTEVRQDSLGTIYRFQCLPSGDRVFYSKIMPFEIPAFEAPSHSPDLTSEQTVIEYRVPAGGTSVFSAVYVTAPFTLGVITATVTAPELTPEQSDQFNPIPDPEQKPLTPFTSGKWKAAITSADISQVANNPYTTVLYDLNKTLQLPQLDSPEHIRNALIPQRYENLTTPLYDFADGWVNVLLFIPRACADVMITAYTPFTSAIADCKNVLLSFTGDLAELMIPVYEVTPLMYLFIPDFVWVAICLVIVLLIIHALLVFVLGHDMTVYYIGRDTIVADAVPSFPELHD